MPWLNKRRNGSSKSTTPISRRNMVKKREYKRCRIACSTPPTYMSTGTHSLPFSVMSASLACGDGYLRKYHDEPAHWGIVSVSRFAGPPQLGQRVFTQSWMAANGDSPVPVG